MLSSLRTLLLLAALSLAAADLKPCSLVKTGNSYLLQSGFVQAIVNLTTQTITFKGDFSGLGNFGVATGVFSLASITNARQATRTSSSLLPEANPRLMQPTAVILQDTTSLVALQLIGVTDSNSIVVEDWEISIEQSQRHAVISTQGEVINTKVPVKGIVHNFDMPLISIFGFFEQGVVQMLKANPGKNYFGSHDYVHRVYGLGGGGCLDIHPADEAHVLATVLYCDSQQALKAQFVVAGEYAGVDVWGTGWAAEVSATLKPNVTWTASYAVAPNDRNFPAKTVPVGNNLPERDLEAFMTGVYASAAGCLSTYPNTATDGGNNPLQAHVAFSAPTLNHPARSYTGNYNFFDPDNFITLSALLYSGDPYLQNQARLVIEQNGRYMLSDGQMLHHFQGLTPVYIALAGVKQTGPNIFWTKAALQYVTSTGNTTWLADNVASLRQSVAFCTGLIESDTGLLYAPGSLMIDCFLRENYTTDSNAMMPAFARQFADVEEFVGNKTGAAALRGIATRMVDAVNSGPYSLWDSASGDHYVTNKNLDNSTRDFVDYDGNLIAVANNVAPDAWAEKILKRIDNGFCTHSRSTFVSEIWYGPADTLPIGNTGDSWTSMGRIAWFDAQARRRMGDQETFDTLILDPILNDVVQYTWVSERFGCDSHGQPTDPGGSHNRSQNFFEFPSVGVMLMREIRYGINLGLNSVTVSPFGPTSFSYHIGNVNVDFSAANVTICVPGSGLTLYEYTVKPVVASTMFTITQHGACSSTRGDTQAKSDANGVLAFSAPAGATCCVSATQITSSK